MISVCIATYNGGKFLTEQVKSILPQLSDSDEIIVSDDGSTDGSFEVIASMNTPIIKCVKREGKNDLIANFENALSIAKGDVIFLSDQDDVWASDKVEKMTEALERYDCVVSDCYVTDRKLSVIKKSFYAHNGTRRGRTFNLLGRNGYLGCCMAFKRKVLERALPFPKKLPMHDIWIGNVAAFFFSVGFISDKLIYFRRHKDNASFTVEKSQYSMLKRLKIRYVIMKNLLQRR